MRPFRFAVALAAARRTLHGLLPRADERSFRALRIAFYRDFWRDAAHAVGALFTEVESGVWRIERGAKWTLAAVDQVALDDALRARLARSKLVTARLLEADGFVTPPSVSFDLQSLAKAFRFLETAGAPLVVKPDGVPKSRFVVCDGPGAGRGVTCGLRTPREIERAARWAALFGARLIAEKQVAGAAYRLLYLDGELIDAVRRDPPRVFGDGVSTIADLVRAENAERRGAEPAVALHPLAMDLDCRLTLERQGLRPGSVPPAFRAVAVKTACNQNAAYDNHVARGAVHPELARLAGRLVRRLGLRLAGVDVMTSDAARAPAAGNFYFSEINANPGLHHHWLVAEPQSRAPVGARVLEAALA
jgi:cyanophycin synthetase